MLDMFPERPVLERADEQDEPLKEVHRFYDISNLVRWNKQEKPGIRQCYPLAITSSKPTT